MSGHRKANVIQRAYWSRLGERQEGSFSRLTFRSPKYSLARFARRLISLGLPGLPDEPKAARWIILPTSRLSSNSSTALEISLFCSSVGRTSAAGPFGGTLGAGAEREGTTGI